MQDHKHFEKFYPLLAAITLPCVESNGIGECVSDIYQWSLAVVGIVAFVQIIYAGWLYLTAAGNTNKTGQAMSKIGNAVLGIVLLFSSYLILRTINPDLVGGTFSLPKITKTGVFSTSTPAPTTTTILGNGTNSTPCVGDDVCIESFTISPTTASIKAGTELLYTLKISAPAKVFGNVDSDCKYTYISYQVYVRVNQKNTLVRGDIALKKDLFGPGQTLTVTDSFAEKLNKVTIDPKAKSARYFVKVFCDGTSRKIGESTPAVILINP